jgi:putative intracellular protease/amidase
MLIAAAVVGLLCVGGIIAASGSKKNDDPPDDASAKLSPTSPQPKGKRKDNPWVHGGKSGIAPKVLFVLPSKGVWLADYLPVRERLEAAGITVETASSDGGNSKPLHNPKLPGEPVKIDHMLTSTFDTSPYAALVFCGAEANEYAFPNRGASAARSIIKQMVEHRKPVCAICLGQMALVANDVLRRKRAAESQLLYEKMPYLTKSVRSEINWVKERVVASDKIITAATDADAIPFAEAILSALKSD